MDSGFAGRRKQIESALLDYQRTPGKYPLLLRRPQIVFSSIREVLQLASGRLPDGAATPGLAVQRAAGFFVRTALLYPAADHYALLGLERTADAAAIKERYRQMMRLTHPDFASSAAAGGSWPADAASRINQAYEVLASDAQRRSYDEQLGSAATAAPHRAASTRSVVRAKAATASAASPDPRRLLKRMAGAFGILGAIGLAASLLARGPDGESLVQRATAPPVQSMLAQADVDVAPIALPLEQSRSTDPARTPLSAPATIHKPSPIPSLLAQLEPTAPAAPASGRRIAVSVDAPAALQGSAPARTPTAAAMPAAMPAAMSVASPAAMSVAMPVASTAAIAAATPARLPGPSAAPVAAPLTSSAPVVQPPALPLIARAQPKPKAIVVPAVTMAEAHTLLSALLQQMESGSGERLLSALDRSARTDPSAQALVRQYNSLVEGSRSVKVSNLLLKGAPREDRLLVKGQVLLEIGGDAATRSSELLVEAEFAKRDGVVLMTRLAPAQVTGAAR